MITKAISESENISQLSPKALSLFCLLIPHFNAHGKMRAGDGYIKDLVCPLIPWLSQNSIPKFLTEISEHTAVKYFHDDKGLPYLQSLNWHNHQKLEEKKLGTDELPNYSDTYKEVGELSPTKDGEVALEVEVEVKEEVEVLSSAPQPDTEPQTLDPPLQNLLDELPTLALVGNGDSSDFWDGIYGSVFDYDLDVKWLFKELRGIDRWQVDNPDRASRTVRGMRQRISTWVNKALDKMTTTRRA